MNSFRSIARSTVMGSLVAVAALAAPAVASAQDYGFIAAGDPEQTFVVPAHVFSVHVRLVGGPGEDGADAAGSPNSGGDGGTGAIVDADLPVTPGEVLYVEIGAPGSIGGNGGGGSGYHIGGGATDVRTCSINVTCPGGSLRSRLAVAGGGGGGADSQVGPMFQAIGGSGGSGGAVAASGTNGQLFVSGGTQTQGGGRGATGVDGGAGGFGYDGTPGTAGSAGTLGDGGAGNSAAGGGGGYYGGGGGGASSFSTVGGGGGGAGSSWVEEAGSNVAVDTDATRVPVASITPAAPVAGPTCNNVGVRTSAGGNTVFVSLDCAAPAGYPVTSWAVVTPPAHGTLSTLRQASGDISYTPTDGFSGTDTFTYRSSNASDASNVATVTVTVPSLLAAITPLVVPAALKGSTAPLPSPVAVQCVVPKVVGLSLAKATKALKAAHCALGKVTKPKATKGHPVPKVLVVTKAGAKAGARLAINTKVALTLGAKK